MDMVERVVEIRELNNEYDVFLQASLLVANKLSDYEMRAIYSHYIHTGEIPTWVQCYCENILGGS